MNKYKLLLAYDGTRFGGWQVQRNSLTIQEVLEAQLALVLRHPVQVIGAGRTDAGVHALGQVAHFTSEAPLDCFRVIHSLNGLLPKEIRVLDLSPAPPSFHACYSAKGKIYRYHLYTQPVMDPFLRGYRTHFRYPYNLEQLQTLSSCFVGTHNFQSFSNEASKGSCAKDPVRTIHRFQIEPEPGGIVFEIEGDGFLYKMVRNIVGTLMDVICGKIAPEDLSQILTNSDRTKAGRTAPPQGLFLVKVLYTGSN